MAAQVSDQCLDVIFREARTHTSWLPKDVTDETLRRVYDLAKLGPTSANSRCGYARTLASSLD